MVATRRRWIERRALAGVLLMWGACSPASIPVRGEAAGPDVVLDADEDSRSFVVHPCYTSPEDLQSVRLEVDAELRATAMGDIDPWVRIILEPADDQAVFLEFVDRRIVDNASDRLSIEHWLDESDLFHADVERGDRSWLCDEGMAVVTFELVDPSQSSRVEIQWDVLVESSVFMDAEALDVHVKG